MLLAGTAGPTWAVTITRTIALDRSIAGVSVRETRASIERRIGPGFVLGGARNDNSTSPPSHVERIQYDAAGLYITYVSRGATPRLLGAGRATVLETTWPSFTTSQGVHVGSSLAAVKKIPGTRCFASVCEHGYSKTTGGSGTSFLIDATRRKVVRIVVSSGG